MHNLIFTLCLERTTSKEKITSIFRNLVPAPLVDLLLTQTELECELLLIFFWPFSLAALISYLESLELISVLADPSLLNFFRYFTRHFHLSFSHSLGVKSIFFNDRGIAASWSWCDGWIWSFPCLLLSYWERRGEFWFEWIFSVLAEVAVSEFKHIELRCHHCLLILLVLSFFWNLINYNLYISCSFTNQLPL